MTIKSMVESYWAEDMGHFLYHRDLDTRKITRSLKNLLLKIINKHYSSVFDKTFLNLITTCCLNIRYSIHVYIYTYIYIVYIYIYIYYIYIIYIYIYIYIASTSSRANRTDSVNYF